MSGKFIISGGKSLKGKIDVRGAKNAATPILAACLLTEEPCVIDNLPLIEDVFRIVDILKSLGAEIDWLGERKIKIQAKDIDPKKIDQETVCRLRSSILFLGSLFARFNEFSISHPGGCLIGSRPVDTHFAALKSLGGEVVQENGSYQVRRQPRDISEQKIILREFSVTATENLLMASVLGKGKISLRLAATEPHVQELAMFLNKMGAKISGIGTHNIEIEQVQKLHGVEHVLMSDPIEAGTFIIAAAATRGKVEIENINPNHLDSVLEKLREMGIHLEIKGNSVLVEPSTRFHSARIQTLPYPGIPTDLQAPFAVFCTQAEGTSLIHDPLYEGRFKYIGELVKMGANASILDPHRAVISGPTPLYGKEIASFDLRAGATLIIAALVAEGESTISDIYQVDRGYEKIEERLAKIGADIKRI